MTTASKTAFQFSLSNVFDGMFPPTSDRQVIGIGETEEEALRNAVATLPFVYWIGGASFKSHPGNTTIVSIVRVPVTVTGPDIWGMTTKKGGGWEISMETRYGKDQVVAITARASAGKVQA